jgi:tetratricopeptide (TPR) repeat protein
MSMNAADLLATIARLAEQGHDDGAQLLSRRVLAQRPDIVSALAIQAKVTCNKGDLSFAVELIERALAVAPDDMTCQVEAARIYELAGDPLRAGLHWQNLIELWYNYPDASRNYLRTYMPGLPYTSVLREAHLVLKPSVYLEIGVREGMSLAFARAAGTAIGIDPDLGQLRKGFGDWPKLYGMESDRFFGDGHYERHHAGARIDLAFVDGLHHFDAVLRDIANIERRAHAGTAILVHDVIPYHARGQAREEMSLMWTGDVWKAMVGLQRWRPDLSVTVIRTQPTGLALIQGFDPENDVLFAKHEEMVATLMPLPYDRGYREQEGIAEADASIDTVRALLRGPAA